MEHFIRFYDNVLSKETCEGIIDLFENDPKKKPGMLSSGIVSDNKISTDLSITKESALNPIWHEYDEVLSKSMSMCLQKYGLEFQKHLTSIKGLGDSGYLMMKYDANKGAFNAHSDVNGLQTANRMLACIWYLNDVEEGGETYFFSQDYSIKPVAGRFAIFPAFFTHLHQGKIATTDKYVISSFATYNA